MRIDPGFPRLFAVASCAALAAIAAPAVAQNAADEEITIVDALMVEGKVPVPAVGDGAPLMTPEEIVAKGRLARLDANKYEREIAELERCYIDAYGMRPIEERTMGFELAAESARKLAGLSIRAEEATERMEQLRADVAAGAASVDDLVAAELARQALVREMTAAESEMIEGRAQAIDAQELSRDKRDLSEWFTLMSMAMEERANRLHALVPKEFEDLALENIQARELHNAKGEPYLQVTGQIRNTRDRRIAIPPINVIAIDEFGYELLTKTANGRGRIAPGEATPFSYALDPSPVRSATVMVSFAGIARPAELLPASVDPVCVEGPVPQLNPISSGRVNRGLPNFRNFMIPPG
jgi:hypothetical protein